MIEQQRHKFSLIVDYFYADYRANTSIPPWSLNNINKIVLLGCVKLDDIPKLRCLYLAARHEDSVFVNSLEEDDEGGEEKDSETGDLTPKEAQVVERGGELPDTYAGFSLKLKEEILEYQENPGDMDIQMNLLQHMTNFTVQAHFLKTTRAHGVKQKRENLQPSGFLNIEVRDDQIKILNPKQRDVQEAMIIEQSYGEAVKKKEARRRIDIISGNAASYSRLWNSKEQLSRVKEFNEVADSLAMINTEKDKNKRKQEEEKKQSGAEKEAKKAKRIEDEAEKCTNLLPGLTADVDRGYEYVKTLNNDRLKEIIRFYFLESLAGLGNKYKLLGKLEHFIAKFDNVSAEMVSNEGNGEIEAVKIQIHIDNSFIWLRVT